MPGKTMPSQGNLTVDAALYLPSVTFPTVAANGTNTSTLTVPGVLPFDFLSWNMQSPPAHLVLDNAYVSAANTVTLLWSSDSTGISTATVALLLGVARIDGGNLGAAGIPAAFV